MCWITVLGLPVSQPYRKEYQYKVSTVMQNVLLSVSNDRLPVSIGKQRTAFPPNYVHSLDSTHMFLTALKMKEKGLTFASVDDSYWTHAGDVDVMGQVSVFIL